MHPNEVILPKDSDESESLVQRITSAMRESANGRRLFLEQALLNDILFLGHIPETEVPRDGLSYILINKTGQSIIARTQIQTETRPRVEIAPRQSAVIPDLWMTRKALVTIKSLIEQGIIQGFAEEMGQATDQIVSASLGEPAEVEEEGFRFDQLGTSNATSFRVTESFVQRVQPLFAEWQGADGQLNAPILKQGDVFEVTDSIVANALQNNWNISWEMDDRDLWLRNNIVNNLKFGTQGAMFVFDKETRKTRVFDIHVKNLYLPPNCTGIKDAEYVGVREIISEREALERYPYATDEIKASVSRQTNSTVSVNTDIGEDVPYSGITFERNMLEVWHVWFRNERYAMTEEQAVELGRVVKKPVMGLEEGGEPQSVEAYFLTDDDFNITEEQTAPDQPNWPSRLGIKYAQMIARTPVVDEECSHSDIPVVINQNIPVSFSPWCAGEPERLWFVQKLIDRMSSIILDHITYFRSPQQILPISVYKKLKGLNTLHSRPDKDAYLDDQVFEQYRDFLMRGNGFYVNPPTMPQGYFDLWQFSIQLHNDLSGYAGVLRGESPGANASGKKVELLQQAARGITGFSAAQTEAMLRSLVRLELDAWVKWVPLKVWALANDQYPVEVLGAIRDRAKELVQNIAFDITVEIASGGGETRQRKQANAMVEVQAGLRSPESYRKIAEISDDPQWEQQRQMAQMQAQAQQSAPPATQNG